MRLTATVCVFVLWGCGAGNTEAEFGPARSVDKDKRPTVWETPARDRLGLQDMGAARDAGAGEATRVVATTPPGWEELPANPARFRNAVWRVAGEPDTDCYLTLGVGGGVAGNLTRWYRNQFGIQEVPAVESLPVVELAGRAGRLAQLEGTFGGKPDQAAWIAFYSQGDRVTSLKFTGPAAVVRANRDAFLALARSIRLATGGPAPDAPPIEPGQPMPEGHPPLPGGDEPHAAVPAATAAPFTADVPAGWQAEAGSSRALHHTFGGSEVYVSQLGGALKPSLDIWRGEVGLGPMSDAEFEALPNTLFLGDDAVLMDLSGTFRGMTGRQIEDARLLVAARRDGSSITFCKLVGPAAEVASHRDEFVRFLGSIRRTR